MNRLPRLTLLSLLACLTGLPTPGATGTDAPAQEEGPGIPLPTDPDIVRGRLSNGLRFAIAPMHTPADGAPSVTFLLQINAGSVHEQDDQTGAAQLAADLGASGRLGPDPAEFERTLASFGLDRSRAVRSFSTFDTTRFTLVIPLGDGESLSSADIFRAVELLAGLIGDGDGGVDPEALQRAKGRIIARQRAWGGASQRITARAMPHLLGDTLFAQRVPIYAESDLAATDRAVVDRFIASWYTPRSSTLVVSGPVDAKVVQRAIKLGLGTLPSVDAPDPPDLSFPAGEAGVVRVESDPGVTGDIVQMLVMEAPGPVLDTHLAMRDRLARMVAIDALNRRLTTMAQDHRAATLQAGAFSNTEAASYRMNMLSASGRAGSWSQLMREAVGALQAARTLGFSGPELEASRRSILAVLEREAAGYAEASSEYTAAQIAGRMGRDEALVSGEQLRQIGAAILPHLTPDEVRRALADLFDHRSLSTLVVTPEPGPDVARVRAEIERALAEDPAAIAAVAAPLPEPRDLLDCEPQPGQVLELAHHADLDITTAVLSSGVTLHHRPMDVGSGRIEIALALLGGLIEQTPATSGATQSLRALQDQPATRSRTGQEIGALIGGRSIDLRIRVHPESVVLEISTTPQDFELAMRLLSALAREPVIEPAAFARWRESALHERARARTEPARAALALYEEHVLTPLKHRGAGIDTPAIESVTMEQANAWLERLVDTAPITVAITGDIDRTTVLQAGAALLGSLKLRAPASDQFEHERHIEFPSEHIDMQSTVSMPGAGAAVVVGFRSADADSLRDALALDIASRIISDRLRDAMHDQTGLSASLGVWNIDGEVYRGSGRFWMRALVNPERTGEAAALLQEQLDLLKASGPTEQELQRAKISIAQHLRRQSESPDAWASVLARDRGLRGEPLATLRDAPGMLEGLTSDDVAAALARYAVPERSFRIVVGSRSTP